MMNRAKIIEYLREYRKEKAQEYGIEEIGLFGSYARNSFDAQSDVDVFVRLQHSSLFLLSRIRIELEEWIGLPVDIVQVRDRMNDTLKRRIEKDAISA
ncbi:nucleotidyltransferase domain-containing protein [Nitratifractor sp.]|uniref:nucleotidyltransferase family protein n=1 Tax=Nitratifractor sp. TaxID=2268144 RepID=UPI0025F13BE9|nr:nucleotidyltransferase domain-containing protein [Nitratifractor sp.]